MAFGTATVVTNLGKAILADRVRTTPATYTVSPHYCAMGTGATGAARTAAATDTALTTEVETRATGTESTVTTTNAGDTYQVTATITATAPRAVDEAGLFDASAAGHMFVSATFAVENLLTGDGIAFTWEVQLT
ncbi:MAG: hypothetical protein KGL39_31660 [Patescibacteria group bacterium]|nr:hypothetical protein [Patescibacteria group bacterium]